MSDDAVVAHSGEGTSDDLELTDVQVQVVRGAPDDLELAALVAGLVAAAGEASDEPAGAPRDAWTDRARGLRLRSAPGTPPVPGPDSWRWSLRG